VQKSMECYRQFGTMLRSFWLLPVPRVYAQLDGNSLIVGMAYLSSAFTNLFFAGMATDSNDPEEHQLVKQQSCLHLLHMAV